MIFVKRAMRIMSLRNHSRQLRSSHTSSHNSNRPVERETVTETNSSTRPNFVMERESVIRTSSTVEFNSSIERPIEEPCVGTESHTAENVSNAIAGALKWQIRIIVHEVLDIAHWEPFPSPYITFHDETNKKKICGVVFKKSVLLDGTDVHTKCVNKNGLFNYRFVHDGEGLLPVMKLKLMEEDRYSKDDYLGYMRLDFTAIPEPESSPENITKIYFLKERKYLNLLEYQDEEADFPRTLTGYWAVKTRRTFYRRRRISGKMHLTIQILTEEEFVSNPVLRGIPVDDDLNAQPRLEVPERDHGDYTNSVIDMLESGYRKFRFNIVMKILAAFALGIIQILGLIICKTFSESSTPEVLLEYSIIVSYSLIMISILLIATSKKFFRRHKKKAAIRNPRDQAGERSFSQYFSTERQQQTSNREGAPANGNAVQQSRSPSRN